MKSCHVQKLLLGTITRFCITTEPNSRWQNLYVAVYPQCYGAVCASPYNQRADGTWQLATGLGALWSTKRTFLTLQYEPEKLFSLKAKMPLHTFSPRSVGRGSELVMLGNNYWYGSDRKREGPADRMSWTWGLICILSGRRDSRAVRSLAREWHYKNSILKNSYLWAWGKSSRPSARKQLQM